MGYDMEHSLNEFINPEKGHISIYQSKISKLQSELSEYESMRDTLIDYEEKELFNEEFSTDIDSLKTQLDENISDVKRKIAEYRTKIHEQENRLMKETPTLNDKEKSLGEKYFGFLKEDKNDSSQYRKPKVADIKDLKINASVFVKDINQNGKITGINTVVGMVNILTSEGDTVKYPLSELNKNIQFINRDIENREDELKQKESDLADEFTQTSESNNLMTTIDRFQLLKPNTSVVVFNTKLKGKVINVNKANRLITILTEDGKTLTLPIDEFENSFGLDKVPSTSPEAYRGQTLAESESYEDRLRRFSGLNESSEDEDEVANHKAEDEDSKKTETTAKSVQEMTDKIAMAEEILNDVCQKVTEVSGKNNTLKEICNKLSKYKDELTKECETNSDNK
jgi:hypothetical protein